MLNIEDFMQTDARSGHDQHSGGPTSLMNSPAAPTFLLWMLSELFEMLPEVGDLEKPKLVFFLTRPTCCLPMRPGADRRIELVVRPCVQRCGVYFVTQNPLDILDSVLAQLGNRVQHALRVHAP